MVEGYASGLAERSFLYLLRRPYSTVWLAEYPHLLMVGGKPAQQPYYH